MAISELHQCVCLGVSLSLNCFFGIMTFWSLSQFLGLPINQSEPCGTLIFIFSIMIGLMVGGIASILTESFLEYFFPLPLNSCLGG